jgi:DNA-binding transcriptional LysR family regulator
MEITHLRALVMIVREGSFTAAAEKLFVTQPALSQQIKGLETEVGVQLLERRGRRFTVTAPGEVVLAHAEQILAHLQQVQADLARASDIGARASTHWHQRHRLSLPLAASGASFSSAASSRGDSPDQSPLA